MRTPLLSGPPVPGTHPRSGTAGAIWGSLLVASDAPSIAWHLTVGGPAPGWLGVVSATILGAWAVAAGRVARWRPMQGYLLALLAFSAGGTLADALAFLAPGRWDAAMLVRSALQLLPCALMALTLRGSGLERRALFLTRGDMKAPGRLAPGLPACGWARQGPVILVVLAGGLSVQLALTVRPDPELLGRALVALPIALAFAALNAAQEEFRFRAVLLARLVPLTGATRALLATSTLFGLAHYFGHPSGLSGVLLAGLAGWIWGRSMLDTGGAMWAWLIHAAQDVIIVLAIAMAHGN